MYKHMKVQVNVQYVDHEVACLGEENNVTQITYLVQSGLTRGAGEAWLW